MPDRKITDLTALTGANTAAGDLFVVVDVSDTTMAASGTDKKITRDELNVALGILPPTRQILTVGTGTYTTPTGCTSIVVEVIGAGGGGGGVTGALSQTAGAGGGGSGGYAWKLITGPSSTYAYTVGAKGAGGTAGANNGSNGSASTFGSPAIITVNGGFGGTAMATGTTNIFVRGGRGADVGTGGDANFGGSDATHGLRYSATLVVAGSGGPSQFGGPGRSQDGSGAGEAGQGYGSGGGGAVSTNNATSRAGGAGSDGVIVVTEYYG